MKKDALSARIAAPQNAGNLFQNTKIFSDLFKCLYSFVKMFCFVSSGKLYTYTGFSFGDNREIESDDIDAFLKEI